ncbi:hypothetical protein [Sphingobacterium siyangense]|uniref:hypothetical protein n=1 Tax=Sphingobacterium siyangense TaxID=459529 RepID=UPI003DA4E06F
MIDGIKIRCIGTSSEQWERNPLLLFGSKVDTSTGEILKGSKVAFYRGLSFHIVPSTVSDNVHLLIRGSLATYYNNGVDNAFDFNIVMLSEVLADLQNIFFVNLNTAVVQSLEYGTNISPSKPIKSILIGLRAYKGNEYALLKIDGKQNGRQLKRTETIVKIYDKGKQIGKPKDNILRVEYVLKYSRQLTIVGVCVLADLLNMDVLGRLKIALLAVWNESIFYDTGMRWRLMTDKQQKQMLYYLDATNWAKFTRMQRLRATARFNELNVLFGTSTTQAEISNLLSQKLDYLTAEKCYVFQNFSDPNNVEKEATKMLRFPSLDKDRKRNKKTNQNPLKNGAMKKQSLTKTVLQKTVQKVCAVCGSDISHKQQSATYCTKRCNNSMHAKRRKEKRHERHRLESAVLVTIAPVLGRWSTPLAITYVDGRNSYTDILHSTEIVTTYHWIRKVVQVSGAVGDTTPILTGNRAKELIKRLNQLNKQNINNHPKGYNK